MVFFFIIVRNVLFFAKFRRLTRSSFHLIHLVDGWMDMEFVVIKIERMNMTKFMLLSSCHQFDSEIRFSESKLLKDFRSTTFYTIYVKYVVDIIQTKADTELGIAEN